MRLVILPGNGQKSNELWTEDSAKALSEAFQDTYQGRYSHWGTDQEIIDFDQELQNLSEVLQNEKEYVIFGKSAGAMLALYGVGKGVLKPERCVFVGLPLKWAKKNNFPLREWLEKFDVPTVLIQQTDDKFASFEEVQELLAELEKFNIELEQIPGSDHGYEDFALFKERAMNFLLQKEREGEHLKERENLHLK